MELSARLEAVVSFVDQGSRAADVGTDHAYVPICLVERGICDRVIAIDVREGPLRRAREHIAAHNLSDYIETRLSDGTAGLKAGEADTLIAAGMGGRLIRRILLDGEALLKTFDRLILQPQSEVGEVRHFLKEHGYRIIAEDMVIEDGKYYPMMAVVPGIMDYEREIDFAYGKLLVLERHPVLLSYLEERKEKILRLCASLERKNADSGAAGRRLQEMREELTRIGEAIDAMR